MKKTLVLTTIALLVSGSAAAKTWVLTNAEEGMDKGNWQISSDQLKVLLDQIAQTRGFPEIAGGYSTTRHITNAIRRVINTKEDPRETLLNYARTINEEIRIKRQEFNLPLD